MRLRSLCFKGGAQCTLTRQSRRTPSGKAPRSVFENRPPRGASPLCAAHFYVRVHVTYVDGSTIEPGDIVRIDGQYSGRVLASMDTSRYLPGYEHWAELREGIMVDTNFGGLVHYREGASDVLELVQRGTA